MEIDLGDTSATPFGNDHVLGPMMVWPPANGFVDSSRTRPAAIAAQAEQKASAAICLPDLSAENPFV